jgi:serine/threonine-protein kinase
MAMRPVYSSDIYALGVTCIYLLTAKSPKDLDYNPNTGEMMWEHLVNVSPHLSSIIRKMLEVSVRSRFQSADEVLKALEMEPYLQDLEKGLVSRPVDAARKGSGNRFDDSGILHNHSSAGSSSGGVAQVAAAIRARRAKLIEATASSNQRLTLSKPAAWNRENTNATSGSKSQTIRRFNTEGLLSAYTKGRRDFACYNLALLNLQGVNLSEANFHASVLEKANLQGSNLHNSDFGRASLNRTNLKDANLNKAYLSHADLEGADLRGADLSYAYLNHANLRGANLCGANLTGAKISDEQLALAKTNWMTVRPNGKRGLV